MLQATPPSGLEGQEVLRPEAVHRHHQHLAGQAVVQALPSDQALILLAALAALAAIVREHLALLWRLM